jgi:hypothetical protein
MVVVKLDLQGMGRGGEGFSQASQLLRLAQPLMLLPAGCGWNLCVTESPLILGQKDQPQSSVFLPGCINNSICPLWHMGRGLFGPERYKKDTFSFLPSLFLRLPEFDSGLFFF